MPPDQFAWLFWKLNTSIIISVAICGAFFGVSLVFNPNELTYNFNMIYMSIMGLLMILIINMVWKFGIPKVIREIKATFVGMAVLNVVFSVLFLIPLVIHDVLWDHELTFSSIYSFPPIVIIISIIGFIIYPKIRNDGMDHYIHWFEPRAGSTYGFTTRTQNNVEKKHYNKDGNYSGVSYTQGDRTVHYDKDDHYIGSSYAHEDRTVNYDGDDHYIGSSYKRK